MISLGMAYMISQLDVSEAYLDDPLWSDAPEELPDKSFILVREIKKAKSGDDFLYIPAGEKRQKEVIGIDPDDFNYYLSVHRYSKRFGLPSGRGWIHELPWIPSFLLYMDDIHELIKAWMMNKKGGSGGGADPSRFTGG